MAAWLCQWDVNDDPHAGEIYVLLHGPSNADGVGVCGKHLGAMTREALESHLFVVACAPGQIPEQAVRSTWRRAG